MPINDKNIFWGEYGNYAGWWTPGDVSFPSAGPTDPLPAKYIAVLGATEGRPNAVNGYDSGGISGGGIQLLEIPLRLLSPLLGAIHQASPAAWEPMAARLAEVGGRFIRDRTTWTFYEGTSAIDTEAKQRAFWLRCSGKKGSWTPEAKAHQKAWVRAVANCLGHPDAVRVQYQFLLPRMMNAVAADVQKLLFKQKPQMGWHAALQAIYISFAWNNGQIAREQLLIGLNGRSDFDDPAVALDAIRQLVFGSGIKIYPERYGTRQYAGRGIRATVERLYGIDLPDYAEDLRGDMMSVLEVQQALKKAGFDPGPLDGIWGKKTAGAVAAFQEREDIEESHVRDVTAAALRAFL